MNITEFNNQIRHMLQFHEGLSFSERVAWAKEIAKMCGKKLLDEYYICPIHQTQLHATTHKCSYCMMMETKNSPTTQIQKQI